MRTTLTRSKTNQSVVSFLIKPTPLFPSAHLALVIRRGRTGVFGVLARRSVKRPGPRTRLRWSTQKYVKNIKTAKMFVAGVSKCGRNLGIGIGWDTVLAKLSELDWPFSVAVARVVWCTDPQLPPPDMLLGQRHLNRLGKVTVRVEWGTLDYELSMKITDWIRICSGKEVSFKTKEWYEGERFNAYWCFYGGADTLRVDGDDCAEYHVGTIQDALVNGPLVHGVNLGVLIRDSYLEDS